MTKASAGDSMPGSRRCSRILSLIYLTEIPARFFHSAAAARTVGLWQFLTGLWLMYMTIATTLDLSFPTQIHLWL